MKMNVLSAGSEDSCICDFNWRIIAESLTELSRRQHCRMSAACDSRRMTLVLFRTRRRDECFEAEGRCGRRVRKSRQKEAAGAAGAGLMQIEWSERGCRSSRESSGPVEEKPTHLCKDEVDGRSEPRRGEEEDVWVATETHFGETL